MVEVKRLLDPGMLLNPGVLLNEDPRAPLAHLKVTATVEAEVDRCVECGYCEPACPSKDLTITPRQRIVLRRERERARLAGDRDLVRELDREYGYDGLDSCAADGMCQSACPVGINTGELVKRLRAERGGAPAAAGWTGAARHWGAATRAGAIALTAAKALPPARGPGEPRRPGRPGRRPRSPLRRGPARRRHRAPAPPGAGPGRGVRAVLHRRPVRPGRRLPGGARGVPRPLRPGRGAGDGPGGNRRDVLRYPVDVQGPAARPPRHDRERRCPSCCWPATGVGSRWFPTASRARRASWRWPAAARST